MIKKIKLFLAGVPSSKYKVFLIIFVLTVVASLQSYLHSTKSFGNTVSYTHYNNYIIYKQSFFHLINNLDLYCSYLNEHWDLYRYSPFFALFFGLFAYLPDFLGLLIWNFLNASVLVFALYSFRQFSVKNIGFIVLLLAIELMTSLQNEQSNALIAGLLILGFSLLEKKYNFYAVGCLAFAVFIKPFAILGFVFLIFYNPKWRLASYSLFWIFMFVILPLTIVNYSQLMFLYESWLTQIKTDHGNFYGMSLLGILTSVLKTEINKQAIVIGGCIILFLPLVRIHIYNNFNFRLLTLCSILIWIVIFNHKAESPTFVIAMAGVSIWYISQNKSSTTAVLVIFAFVLTSLSPTDIFPSIIRTQITDKYALKALPCVLVWLNIIYNQMILNKKDDIMDTQV